MSSGQDPALSSSGTREQMSLQDGRATSKDCHLCCYPSWDITGATFVEPADTIPFANLETVQKLAEAGCLGCKIIASAWVHSLRFRPLVFGEATAVLRKGRPVWIEIYDVPEWYYTSTVFTLPGEPGLPHVRQGPMLPDDTSLPNSLPLIRRWLQDCSGNHSKCNPRNDYIPPRLLDLEACSDDVRLVADPIALTDFHYACLSHCWGQNGVRFMTRTDSLARNSDRIPFQELPKTFRESIQLCRELEIRYLWIDSLCIIQDDREDWSFHVSAMHEIYRNAYLTIAAACAHDSDGGLFRTADKQFTAVDRLRLCIENREVEILVRQQLSHGTRDAHDWPLMRRGWVVQEHLLSRRFLSFGANEVFWECSEGTSCSCTTNEPPVQINVKSDGRRTLLGPSDFKVKFRKLSELPMVERYEAWQTLLTSYTSCSLTEPNDRLPAIAGLAKEFKHVLADDYMGGMWRSNLERDLAWQSRPLDKSFFGKRPRKGPSWTWTSATNDRIIWPTLTDAETYKVLHASYERDASESLSYITSGKVVIAGILISLSLDTPRRVLGHVPYVEDRVSRGNLGGLSHGNMSDDIYFERNELSERLHRRLWCDYDFWPHPDDSMILHDVKFLYMGARSTSYRPEKGPIVVYGMLLKSRGVTKDPQEYERLGWLEYILDIPLDQWRRSNPPVTTFAVT